MDAPPRSAAVPRPWWSVTLRALREARGVTQEGWALLLGYSAPTVKRWERGAAVPTAEAEAAIVAVCRAHGLFRPYQSGPLAGVSVTPELLADLLAHARFGGGMPEAAAPTVERVRPRAPLPVPCTSLVGRERELTAATLLLSGGARLLTLNGPGGAGKTRLALAVATHVQDNYPDGVAFVDLSPVADPGLVAAAIAQALGLRERTGQPVVDLLGSFLCDKQLLLVLDNFEQVVEAAPLVSGLLTVSPGLTLLVTSRVLLRLSGEREYGVPPLPLPDPSQVTDPMTLAAAPSVALFVERARAARAGFALTDENAAAVAAICMRLDGLPLALELAAARVRILSPQALLARLDQRLALLTGGARDVPARQQTLRNTIAWSYDLLCPEEQTLFRRLGVFAGGCTLAVAEALFGADNAEPFDLLDGLTALVENSLLQRQEGVDGEPRFTMLETIHEFSVECLARSNEEQSLRRRHAESMVHVARAARRAAVGSAQMMAMQRTEVEHHNLRAALAWALAGGETELALRLCAALMVYWYVKGQYREGRAWMARALATAPEVAPATRADVLYGAAILAHVQDYQDEARSLIEASVALWRTVGGDPTGLAVSLGYLGLLARHVGDRERARAACGEALSIYAQVANTWGQVNALGVLGWIAEDEGDHAVARGLFVEGLAVARAGASGLGIAMQLTNLGIVALRQGKATEADAHYREALTLSGDLDAHEMLAWGLEGMAGVAAAQGCLRRAAWLLGAATTLRAVIGAPRIAQFEQEYCRVAPAVRAVLGEHAFAAATAAGAAAPRAEVLVEALADDGARDRALP